MVQIRLLEKLFYFGCSQVVDRFTRRRNKASKDKPLHCMIDCVLSLASRMFNIFIDLQKIPNETETIGFIHCIPFVVRHILSALCLRKNRLLSIACICSPADITEHTIELLGMPILKESLKREPTSVGIIMLAILFNSAIGNKADIRTFISVNVATF